MIDDRPITPTEVVDLKVVPKAVWRAFNELLCERFSNGYAVIRQEEVIKRVLELDPTIVRADIFERGWLDVEPAFRKAGWLVEYDKPGYNETYEARWKFSLVQSAPSARSV